MAQWTLTSSNTLLTAWVEQRYVPSSILLILIKLLAYLVCLNLCHATLLLKCLLYNTFITTVSLSTLSITAASLIATLYHLEKANFSLNLQPCYLQPCYCFTCNPVTVFRVTGLDYINRVASRPIFS